MIASVSGRGRISMGDASGGGSLLPATRQPPARPAIALGRTQAPIVLGRTVLLRPVATTAVAKLSRATLGPAAPVQTPIDFRGPGSGGAVGGGSPTSADDSTNGGSYAGPGYPADASGGAYVTPGYDASQSPTAADSSTPAPVAVDSQKMTLQQAQASGATPVGYYVAGGVAVLAVGLGLFLVTR